MNTPSHSSPSRRLFNVLAAAIALPLIALVPAFLASSWITHDAIEPNDPIEQAAAIDVTDNDPESTVKYTVSPPVVDGDDSDIEIIVPADMADALVDGDLIKVTVIDQGTEFGSSSSVDTEMEEGCRITLSLSSDDRSNNRIGTYSGYIRIKDDDTFTATYTHDDLEIREDCGLNLTYTD